MKKNKSLEINVEAENAGGNASKIYNVKKDFSVVGIGASAGGLEALLAFLGNVPENSGFAFVIVQHMEKKSKNNLVELLQSVTTMKVVLVYENISVVPNCVYVIPPNKNMSIKHNVLHLSDFIDNRNINLPIDFFFYSMAIDKKENSIGVILSGTGADGTAGLRDIKEKGGGIFIQEPSSAKYDEMPRSAIKTGLADVVSTVETLPSEIISYLELKQNEVMTDHDQTDILMSKFDDIIDLLRLHTNHDFSLYKKNTIRRRTERRMGINQIDDIDTYILFLKENPQEQYLLFKEVLIGVTSFFREPIEWELLKDKVIPQLLAERSSTDTLRVWISGCSTGEEAYTLAIAFQEVLDQLETPNDFSMQIFATDLNIDSINKAREGFFSASIAKDMSTQRLTRYFDKVDDGYRVVKSIRDMVIFAQQNMIKDPPFTKIDILVCRNLLIYLTPEIQKKLMPLFHYSLNDGGFLFLGSAESVGNFTELFKPLNLKSRIYQRLQPLNYKEPIQLPATFATPKSEMIQPSNESQNMQAIADKMILQYYSPSTVFVDRKGEILYITGRVGKYLEPPTGRVNWNIFAMAREGLNNKLSDTFYKALRQEKAVTYKKAVVLNEGGLLVVDITVSPLKESGALSGVVVIIFNDVSIANVNETIDANEKTSANQREKELEGELLQIRHMWQAAGAEMQQSQEEFKSSNEELQSCNEELQSTNEELTTTKEEIQASNEELKMINFELQAKLHDLSIVTKDMKNLMDSTEIATLFLDNALLVKHFTSQMTIITRLISSDVGRPITDIASDLIYPELTADVQRVQCTLIPVERQVMSRDESWFSVRILPYHTLENKLDGVVITFINITK